MRNKCTAVLIAGAIAFSHPARAEDPGPGTETADSGDIIVTAQKRSERLEDVPLSIAVVGGNQLVAQGIVNTFQLREAVPGLNMSEVGIYLMPNIRGITTTVTNPGADANVALYLDGIYQASMGANAFDLPDVDRIEVLKGPQGTLFGRNATGGAIQIFTKGPSFTGGGSASATLGTYAVGGWNRKVSAFVTGPLVADRLAASLSFNFNDNDGYMKNELYGRRLGYRNLTARGKLLVELGGDNRLVASATYARRNDWSALSLNAIGGSVLARSVDPSILLPANGYHSIQNFMPHLKSDFYSASLRGEFDVGVGTVTSLTAYQRSNIHQNDADADASPLGLVEFRNPNYSNAFSQEINFASAPGGPVGIIGGLYYFRDKAAYNPLTIVGVNAFQGRNRTQAYAAFAELSIEPAAKLTLIGGLRYSRETRRAETSVLPAPYAPLGRKSFDSFNPRASIRYEIADRSNIYFTFSTGFKSGLFDVISFNPVALSPEKVVSYELGFKTRGRYYSLEAAAFYYDYRNMQVGAYVGGLNISQNAGKARIAGIDVNVALEPAAGLRLSAGASYIPEAEYVDYANAAASVPLGGCTACGNRDIAFDASGARLIRTPRLAANVGAEYSAPVGKGELGFTTNLYYSGSSGFEVTGRARQERYATLSAELSYTLAAWRFSLWGKNLTDNRRLVQVSQIGTPGDLVNYLPPLEAGVTARHDF